MKMKTNIHMKINKQHDFTVLKGLMREFGSAKRTAFNRLIEGETKDDLKKSLPKKFFLNSRFAEDATMLVEAVKSSQKEQLSSYLENTEVKIGKTEYKYKQYESGKRKPKKVDLSTYLSGLQSRLEKLYSKKEKYKKHINEGTIPDIIFGGKDNFYKRLKGKISKEEWKDLRSNQLYCRGDKNKKGNPNLRIVFDDQKNSFVLQVANTLAIPKGSGKTAPKVCYELVVPDKHFDKLAEIVLPDEVKVGNKIKEYYTPYTVEILRKNGEYFVHLTIDVEEIGRELGKKENFKGVKVAGIDINIDRIAVSIISPKGNLLKTKIFYCHELEYVSSNKRDNISGEVIKKVYDFLLEENIGGIVIEDLKIKQFHDTDKRFNRLTNNFCYKKLSERIVRNALKMGFQIKRVNPAYTSVIGRHKYMKKYGISVHEAASFVIGRRGMGFNEKLSKENIETLKTVIKPYLIKTLGSMEESEKKSSAGKKRRQKLGMHLKKIDNFKTEKEWSLWSIIRNTVYLTQFSYQLKEV